MDPRTRTFLIFLAFSLLSLAVGYAARKRRWLSENASAPMQLHAVLWSWSPAAMVTFWSLPMRGDDGKQLAILLGCQPVLMVSAALVMELITRVMRFTRVQRGTLILGAGLSNHGFTLGAFLCYALLTPGELARSYGIAFVMSMAIFMVLIFYPIASYFGSGADWPLRRLMLDSLISVRAMPLYLSVAGILLNLFEVPVPTQIADWHVMDILFFGGAAAAYAGIGLRLRLGDSLGAWKLHLALAFVHFVVLPLMTWGLISLLHAAGLPPRQLVSDVMLVQSFTPTAINIVILANLFHLDPRLASVLWLWNTLGFCIIVLPLLMWLY